MTEASTPGVASSAVTSIDARVMAAADTMATALGSVIDTATERGRKARKRAGKRARAEIGHQRGMIHKQAKDAKKKSGKAWADFAEETSTRATNMVAASKGGRVTRHDKTRRVTVVLAVAAAVAVVVVRRNQAAVPAATDNPSSRAATTP